jgi:hypothetical protein
MRKLLFAFTSLLLFLGCKKSTDPNAPTVENIAGSYKILSLTMKTGNDPEEDITNLIPACELDNIYTFKKDKTYTISDVGTKCNPPSDRAGTWTVTDQYLELDRNQSPLVKFDGKILKYNSKEIGVNTLVYRTLIKQ